MLAGSSSRAQAVPNRDCAARALYDAISKTTPRATSSHSAPLTPPIADHANTYMIVVQGRRTRPSSGQIQLSNATSTLSPKIHQAPSATRGPKSPSTMSKQHTWANLTDDGGRRQASPPSYPLVGWSPFYGVVNTVHQRCQWRRQFLVLFVRGLGAPIAALEVTDQLCGNASA